METERFRALLEAYGGEPRRWPAEERAAMQAFLSEHSEAEAWRREALSLDLALDAYAVEAVDLLEPILERISQSFADRVLAWLIPQESRSWWRPALAATCPLVLGVVIGLNEAALSDTAMNPDGDETGWNAQEQRLLESDFGSAWYE